MITLAKIESFAMLEEENDEDFDHFPTPPSKTLTAE